ncbi:rhomboid-domain-containing protein [Guyanagaster necrorhizus]|uniref:Rhomboid-domain-containing protein n=1 Tax=Guyanagaster necrorhizus TaxID=856835 RepID=A0A9P8AUZ3_9AGAR|nr:rhomboid-domain-containing protein [Guyanagaster necrorhizus MCA 3950]KAG7448983.1 rhomboid-domain-containing protein [Guyanagaster necrorhizus MCA 3950]
MTPFTFPCRNILSANTLSRSHANVTRQFRREFVAHCRSNVHHRIIGIPSTSASASSLSSILARLRSHSIRPYHSSLQSRRPFDWLDKIPGNYIFYGIMGINGLVFLAWISEHGQARAAAARGHPFYSWMQDNFTSSWRNTLVRPWTLVTAMFSHKGIGHLFFNTFTFFFFAPTMLEMLGNKRFIGVYLASGVIANACHVAWSNIVDNRDIPCMGASGAVYSLISLLACVNPRMIFSLYGIIPIPAWALVPGIFLWEAYSSVTYKADTQAHAGHVAGMLSGVGYFLAKKYRIF